MVTSRQRRTPLIVAGETFVGGDKRHISQQIRREVPELLGGQLNDLDHLDLSGLVGLALHQLLGMAGFEEETAVNRRLWQILTSEGVMYDTLVLIKPGKKAGQGVNT